MLGFCFWGFFFFPFPQLAWERWSTSSGRIHQTNHNTPPCRPSALICSKCTLSPRSWREIWKQPALLFSQLMFSPAHIIPEEKGSQRPVQTPEKGSAWVKVTQQVSSVQRTQIWVFIHCWMPCKPSGSWTFLTLSLLIGKIRSLSALFPLRGAVRIKWGSCDWFT